MEVWWKEEMGDSVSVSREKVVLIGRVERGVVTVPRQEISRLEVVGVSEMGEGVESREERVDVHTSPQEIYFFVVL